MDQRVWLITGSSRGMGRALTEAVLAGGDIVVATARKMADLTSFKSRYPEQVLPMMLDVTNERSAEQVVDAAINRFGRIDVLVNNAGYGNLASIEETPLSDFRAQIETNLFGTIILCKAVLPSMRQRRGGHIINFSSVGGRIGPVGRGAYAAAKWGVEGFSEVLAKEVRPFGMVVTIIEPGGFRTDFAGSSTQIKNGLKDYDETVGATARFQRIYDGQQPGDPDKAAAVVIQISRLLDPPLRLLLGSDAVRAAEANEEDRIWNLNEWKNVSVSTDFSK